MSLIHSLKWSFLAQVTSKAITPVVFIVLARLLTPEDFGVMAAAMMVIAFSQIFWEAGMGKALIQRQTDVEEAADVAFWVNMALGCLIGSLLFWTAEPIAITFFQDHRVTAVLQVMSLQVLLGALSSVQNAFLIKEMSFKKLFWVRLVTVAFPGIASIPLAWNGMGYWALVAGTLAGQAIQVVMLWRMSHWRPSWSFRTALAKEMGRFGVWVGASGVLAWFYVWADSLIVGKYLGTHDLGLYRTGNQVVALVFGLIFAPIVPVLYSHLSRMNGDRQRLKSAIEKVIKIVILVSVPLGCVIFVYADEIASVAFTDAWFGIGFVIGIFSLVHVLSWIIGFNGEVYRSLGQPNVETMAMLITVLVYMVAYLYFVQFGLEKFLWTRLLLVCLGLLAQLVVLKWLLNILLSPFLMWISCLSLYSITVLTIVKVQFGNKIDESIFTFILAVMFSLALIMIPIILIERKRSIEQLINLFRAN